MRALVYYALTHNSSSRAQQSVVIQLDEIKGEPIGFLGFQLLSYSTAYYQPRGGRGGARKPTATASYSSSYYYYCYNSSLQHLLILQTLKSFGN